MVKAGAGAAAVGAGLNIALPLMQIRGIAMPDPLFYGLLVLAAVLFLYGLWAMARGAIEYWRQRRPANELETDVGQVQEPVRPAESAEELRRFEECLPYVKRCKKLLIPYIGLGGIDVMKVMTIGYDPNATRLEGEVINLATRLEDLRIPRPDSLDLQGKSYDDVKKECRTWHQYLVRLEALIKDGNLSRARKLKPYSRRAWWRRLALKVR